MGEAEAEAHKLGGVASCNQQLQDSAYNCYLYQNSELITSALPGKSAGQLEAS